MTRGATPTRDSPSFRITDDQLQTWKMEYGSVKAAAEVHPEIEYELRIRAQELVERQALKTTPAGAMPAAV